MLGRPNISTSGTESTPSKVILQAGVTLTQASAGTFYFLALASDGSLYSWGDNEYGQLGRHTYDNADQWANEVTFPTGVSRFVQISAGYSHSLAIGSDGNLYSWGDNSKGQLGRSASSTQDGTPRRVAMPAGITITQVRIEGGYLGGYALGLGSDGNLYS